MCTTISICGCEREGEYSISTIFGDEQNYTYTKSS